MKINNATHRHFYFLSAPEGTSKNQNSQHPAAKRSTSPNNFGLDFLYRQNSDIFHFSENISKSNDWWVKLLPTWSRFLLQAKLRQFFIFQKTFSKTNDWWINSDRFFISFSLERSSLICGLTALWRLKNGENFSLNCGLTALWRLGFFI